MLFLKTALAASQRITGPARSRISATLKAVIKMASERLVIVLKGAEWLVSVRSQLPPILGDVRVDHVSLPGWCGSNINRLARTITAWHWTLIMASNPLLRPLVEPPFKPLPRMCTMRHMPASSTNRKKFLQWICPCNLILLCF